MNLDDYTDLYRDRYNRSWRHAPDEDFRPIPPDAAPSSAGQRWHHRYETCRSMWKASSIDHPYYPGDDLEWFVLTSDPDTMVLRIEVSKVYDGVYNRDPDSDYATLRVTFEPGSDRLYNAVLDLESNGTELWSLSNDDLSAENARYVRREAQLLRASTGENLSPTATPTRAPARARL